LDASASALSVQDVTKTFHTPEGGIVHALDSVSLEIAEGSFMVLLGPSGCGKTTLLRCIAGLESPDSGQIALRGQRIDDMPVWRRRVNTVFQSYALFPHMTVAQNIAFGLQMDKVPGDVIKVKVEESLDMVHLSGLGSRKPSQLSGGQQQRVALARALAKEPEVLLLDEPLSALDLKLRRGMQSELKRLQRETSITFVLVTHDQDEAMAMGDQVAVFNAGRIVQVGEPREVYLRPRSRFVADFIGEANVLTGMLDTYGLVVESLGLVPRDRLIADTDAASGQVHVAVRPENVSFQVDPVGTAKVTDVSYVGGDMRVEALASAVSIVSRVPSQGVQPPRIGDRISVSFAEGSLTVVAD
jgi:spermidine/putrescine transport system ATP-binding protein